MQLPSCLIWCCSEHVLPWCSLPRDLKEFLHRILRFLSGKHPLLKYSILLKQPVHLPWNSGSSPSWAQRVHHSLLGPELILPVQKQNMDGELRSVRRYALWSLLSSCNCSLGYHQVWKYLSHIFVSYILSRFMVFINWWVVWMVFRELRVVSCQLLFITRTEQMHSYIF